MHIKDLTEEQSKVIAKLAYGFEDLIKSDFTVKYQPFDGSWYEDAREFVLVSFEGIVFGDKAYKIYVDISPDLNVYVGFSSPTGLGRESLPVRNQYDIQKKFREWQILPKIQ